MWSIRVWEAVLEDWRLTNDFSIFAAVIRLRDLRVITILNEETRFTLHLEHYQDTCIAHVLGIHYPGNGDIMLRSVDGCDGPTYQDLGDVSSSDRNFGCDSVSSIWFNSRDDVLAESIKVLDALLVELRKGWKISDTFVSKTKQRSNGSELHVVGGL